MACGLFAYNKIYDYTAGRRAQELLDQMMEEFVWDLPPLTEMGFIAAQTAPADSSSQVDEPAASGHSGVSLPLGDFEPPAYDGSSRIVEEPATVENEESEGASEPAGGWVPQLPSYSTIGILSIPKLGVRLPVIGESSDELLKISCCRISGTVDGKPNRLVLVGHNINSHFKGLDTFAPGDQVAFTTRDGVTYFYSAVEITGLHKSQGADVLAAVGWDLTLITCKTDNTMRTVVRFAEITE